MNHQNTRSYNTKSKLPSEIKVRKGRVFYRFCYEGKCIETLDTRTPEKTAQDCIDKIIEIQDGKHPKLKHPELVLAFLERKTERMEALIS